MKLTDLSKGRDVGCSCSLIEIGPFKIMVDAGIDPGKEGADCIPDFSTTDDFDLDLIILTHCHLDHLGALPVIQKKNPLTPIMTSIPNLSLAPRMLRNSFNVMRKQKEEHNIPEFPLYNHFDIDRTEKALSPSPFYRPRTFHKDGEELDITLYPSGHLVGASGIEIVYKHRRIFITGDTLFEAQRIVPGAKFPTGKIDTIVVETTRGATKRPENQTRESEIDRLIETINHTISRKGSCLIPVFALGRMQEVLVILNKARKEGKLIDCPVFCSGLGLDLVTYFDAIAKKTGLIQFRKRVLHDLKAQKLQQNIRPGEDFKKKGIYLLGSGMLVERTPSYTSAAALIEHPHNSICFVGYAAPDTPGGKLLEVAHGEPFSFDALNYVARVNAHVERFDLSGHADREELVKYITSTTPRAVVLTHGEPQARDWFTNELISEIPKLKVIDPIPGETYQV